MNPVNPLQFNAGHKVKQKGQDIGFYLLFILRYIYKRKRSGCSKRRIVYYFKWYILTEEQCISDGHIHCKVKVFSDFFDIFYWINKYKYKFKKRQMRKFVLNYSKDC